MDALYIISTYVLIDDTLREMGVRDHHHARVSTAEMLTVAVIAAKYFQNHHERALVVLQLTDYIPALSVSRFNRRLHHAWQVLDELLDFWAQQRTHQQHFVVDTMPLPVCQLGRADTCRKIPQTKGYIGRVSAKNLWFCGWRLHWLCDTHGFPIAFDLVPAVWHELTTVQHLMGALDAGKRVYGDGAYISLDHDALAALSGIERVSKTHRAMRFQNHPVQRALLRRYRNVIENAHSVLHSMGVQRLHATTAQGFGIKVYASLLALAINCRVKELGFTSN